jgi:hypothetical protein
MIENNYIERDPEVKAAKAKIISIYNEMVSNDRWGEARRFAGKRAGSRLERLDKARRQLSRAIDRAKARLEK